MCLSTESLLDYVTLYYCYAEPWGWLASAGLLLLCAVALGLAFRLLATTAEDYFSPILTQLSQEMGLPPRFAGGEPACSF